MKHSMLAGSQWQGGVKADILVQLVGFTQGKLIVSAGFKNTLLHSLQPICSKLTMVNIPWGYQQDLLAASGMGQLL